MRSAPRAHCITRNSSRSASRMRSSISSANAPAHGPSVDLERPSVRINLQAAIATSATLSLDLSGTPLHRRGWRRGQGDAPLKENLAAAMLLRGGWPEIVRGRRRARRSDVRLGDAADRGRADGRRRRAGSAARLFRFSRLARPRCGALVGTARRREAARGKRTAHAAAVFFGYDNDPRVLNEARRNAQAAGVAGLRPARAAGRRASASPGRMRRVRASSSAIRRMASGIGERAELPALVPHARRAPARRSSPAGARRSSRSTTSSATRSACARSKRYVLFNGALECRLLLFDLAGERPRERIEQPLSAGAAAVANRITQERAAPAQAARQGRRSAAIASMTPICPSMRRRSMSIRPSARRNRALPRKPRPPTAA